MFIKKFEIGKEYWCTGLYGGEYWIKVVDRTEETVSFVYDERTSDDRSIQVKEIEIQKTVVYGANLEIVEEIETESIVCWKYHSPYAKPGEYDYGYFYAFDIDKLYTPEEWEAEKKISEAKG